MEISDFLGKWIVKSNRGQALKQKDKKPDIQKHSTHRKTGRNTRTFLGLSFLLVVTIGAVLRFIPWAVPVGYFVLSLCSVGFYALDKSAAVNGRWRTPEKTLHCIGLAGGWPGALIAQNWFHHKTRKNSFQVVFWISVVLNCLGCYYVCKL